MNVKALLPLAAMALIAASASSVTVKPANYSYKQLLAACPGSLAAIGFTLHHARIAEAPGVTTDESVSGTVVTAVLGTGSKTVTVQIDSAAQTVSGPGVSLASKPYAACVAP